MTRTPGIPTATEIQEIFGHESLNTSQGYIDATATRADRTYRTLARLIVVTGRPDAAALRLCRMTPEPDAAYGH